MGWVVTPGKYICVDELMSPWKGLEGDYVVGGVPHATKVKSKPKGVGVMGKATADGATRVVIFIEIVEEKADMQLKKFCARTGQAANDREYQRVEPKVSHTVATTLRLVEKWFGSWRIVVGDSWFGSLTTAVELKKKGLHCTLTVKTAHKGLPKTVLQQWFVGPGRRVGKKAKRSSSVERGASKYYLVKFKNNDRNETFSVVAIGWADKTIKTVISTAGHTSEGTKAIRTRHRVVYNPETRTSEQIVTKYEVPRNYIIQKFFEALPAVDINDHYRQGILAMETNWNTKKYHIRVFATLLGVIFTNAFLAFKTEKGPNFSMDYRTFLGKLAHSLIFNTFLNNDHQLRARGASEVYFYYIFL